jgi:pyruvate dehydrogenase E1 component alpha subunit
VPRKPIECETGPIERIEILGEDGTLDTDLEPDLSPDELRKCYRGMLRARRLDERMLKMQRQGRMGTFPLCRGQEASAIGTVFALEKDDWLAPGYREMGALLWVGWPISSVLLYWNGSAEGARVPDGVHCLPWAVPVGCQAVHAVGLAHAMQYKGRNTVALAYFGDGASSQGDVMEAMNFAGVWQAPVVFVCQNNQYAISLPRIKQTRAKTIAQKALAFGFPGVQVDGNDILAVIVATREAVERARSGHGPTLIEAETYRMSFHTTADDPTKYRSHEEEERWARRDPLMRFEKYLTDKGVLTAEQTASWENQIEEEIRAAIRVMDERISRLSVLEAFDHMYAELPPELERQRAECEAELRASKRKGT